MNNSLTEDRILFLIFIILRKKQKDIKMDIGILSMQRVVNNGSFLQAYGLKRSLELLGAANVSFVDFHNTVTETEKKGENIIEILRRIKHFILPKYWSYERTLCLGRTFHQRMIDIYQPLLYPKEYHYSSDRDYDLVIFGSDEVFNIMQFSDLGRPIPWELMGECVRSKKLISYAAACGQTDIESIQRIGETEHCKGLLGRFSALSARDENTLYLLSKLGTCVPEMHIDPVLLLPTFPEDENYRKLSYKYMIVYAYSRRINNPEEIKGIQTYAKKNKLKIVCVNCFQTWCDKSIVTSPFALLQYIADAECVVTDTFHGTVFSIRNNKQFATIVRESNRNKLRSLLKQFGLEAREVLDINKLETIFDSVVDYNKVNNILKIEREKANQYLKEQIRMSEVI